MKNPVFKSTWSPSIPCKNKKVNLDEEKIRVNRLVYSKKISSSIGDFYYSNSAPGSVFSQIFFKEHTGVSNNKESFVVQAPGRVDLELTYKCNLHCRHCYVRKKTFQDFRFESIEKLFTELAGMGVIGIQLIGGEPSLYPKIDRVLEMAAKLKLKIEIVSNGNPRLSEKCLKKAGLINILLISIDGLEKTHDYLRRSKGSFRSAIKSIELFSSKGTTTNVICTLNNKNKKEIKEIVDITKTAGADNLIFKFMLPVGKGEKENDLVIQRDERKEIRQKVIEMRDNYIQDQMYSALNDDGNFSFFGCPAGRFSIRISPSGFLYWCVYSNDKLGNIYEKKFVDIWNDIQKNNFGGNVNCPYRLRCGGPCKLSAKYKEGIFSCHYENIFPVGCESDISR